LFKLFFRASPKILVQKIPKVLELSVQVLAEIGIGQIFDFLMGGYVEIGSCGFRFGEAIHKILKLTVQ